MARPGVVPVPSVIPQGTVNVLARELLLSSNPATIAQACQARRLGKLYVGLANVRPCVLMASVVSMWKLCMRFDQRLSDSSAMLPILSLQYQGCLDD